MNIDLILNNLKNKINTWIYNYITPNDLNKTLRVTEPARFLYKNSEETSLNKNPTDSLTRSVLYDIIKKNYNKVILFNGFNSYIYMFIQNNLHKYEVILFNMDIEPIKYELLQNLLNIKSINIIIFSSNKPCYNLNNICIYPENN